MIKQLSILFIFLLMPSYFGMQKGPEISIPPNGQKPVLSVDQKIALVQKLLFLTSPEDKQKKDQYLSKLFNVSSQKWNDFKSNFEVLNTANSSIKSYVDPFTGSTLAELSQCTINENFADDVRVLLQKIDRIPIDVLMNTLYAQGVSFLLSESRKEALEKDIAGLNDIIENKNSLLKDTLGGEHNRWVLVLWEIAPYLGSMKQAKDSSLCLFFDHYVKARVNAELVKLLTTVHEKYDWRSSGLDAVIKDLSEQLEEYKGYSDALRDLKALDTASLKEAVEKKLASRKKLIATLTEDTVESLLNHLIDTTELKSKILAIEKTISKAQAIEEAFSNFKNKHYQDPSGTQLDLFYQDDAKIWLRATLSEGITRPGAGSSEALTRDAEFSIIVKKGDLPVLTREDFERVGKSFDQLSAGKPLTPEKLSSVIEIPIGVKMLDLKVRPSATVSNARLFYPDSLVHFDVSFTASPVFGTYKNDKEAQDALMNFLGLPPGQAFKLKGIRPAMKPEDFKFIIELRPPQALNELIGEAKTYELTVNEIRQFFDDDLEAVGEQVKRRIAANIKTQLKLLAEDKFKDLKAYLKDYPFLNKVDSVYLETASILKDTIQVERKYLDGNKLKAKMMPLQIEKGNIHPFKFHVDFKLREKNWPEILEYPKEGSFGFAVHMAMENGKLKEKFRLKTVIEPNQEYLDKIKRDIIDAAKKWEIYPDTLKNKLLIDIYGGPVSIDFENRSIVAPILFDGETVATVYYKDGKVGHDLRFDIDIVKKIFKNQAQELLNNLKDQGLKELCDWFEEEDFFVGGIPGWRLKEGSSSCNPQKRTFKKVWIKDNALSNTFSIEGKFDGNGKSKITKVDYSYLSKQLNAYAQSFRDTLNQVPYLHIGQGRFSDQGTFDVPIYLEVDFLSPNTRQLVGTVNINRRGKLNFNGVDFSKAVLSTIATQAKKGINDTFFITPLEADILGQEFTIIKCFDLDIQKKVIGFKASAEIFGQIKVEMDVFYRDGKIDIVPTNAEINELEQLISVDLGIANVDATVNLSLSPLGLKGIAFLQVLGINLPPIEYLLTKDGLSYKLAMGILIPGCYPIAPGVVIIDPRITLDKDNKSVRASTIVTIGATEEARATARLIKLNTFLSIPYEWGEDITYGGDLVLLTVLPMMKGRGRINPKELYFEHRAETSKLISDVIDYKSFVQFDGKARRATGEAYLELLDAIRLELSLSAVNPSGKPYIDFKGRASAELVLANFNIDAKTRMIPGPLAASSALINAEMGLDLAVGKKILGVDLASVSGEASIEQARFDIGILGAEFGVVLPGPNDLDEGVIIDLIKKMFDFRVDISELFDTPNVDDLLTFDPSIKFSTTRLSLSWKNADLGKGKNISGEEAQNGNDDATGPKSKKGSGVLTNVNISHPFEKVGKPEKKYTSCPWYKAWQDCFKWVTVYYDKFNPHAWPQAYSNLPKEYKSGSMIFSTNQNHPKTGSLIKSVIAPINVPVSNKNIPVKVNDIRSDYDFLLTDIKVQKAFDKGNQMVSLCESCSDNALSVPYDGTLPVDSLLSINIAFNKRNDQIAVFTSYNLNEDKTYQKDEIPNHIDSLMRYAQLGKSLQCSECLNVWTLTDSKDSTDIKEVTFPNDANLEFYYRDGNSSKFRDIYTDARLKTYEPDSNNLTTESDTLDLSLRRILKKVDRKYQYLVKNGAELYAFDSIPILGYYSDQSKAEDNAMYELTSKVWVETNEDILVSRLLGNRKAPAKNESAKEWLQEALNDGNDPEFRDLLTEVLNKIIKTNGEFNEDIIEVAELDTKLMVVETNGKWSERGTKTFIVVSSNNSLLEKGATFEFNLAENFGNKFPDLSGKFKSIQSLKSYFKNSAPPMLRNFIVTALAMGEEELSNYYGITASENSLLLARFEEFDELDESFVRHKLLRIKGGKLNNEIYSIDTSSVRLSLYNTPLEKVKPNNYAPVFPFDRAEGHWRSFFAGYRNGDLNYWVTTEEGEAGNITAFVQTGTNQLYQYWFHKSHEASKGAPSSMRTSAYQTNFREVSKIIGFPKDQKANDYLFLLLNKGLYRSSEWYKKTVPISPFSFFRR